MSEESGAKDFYQLTPERILTAVETLGARCSGRFYALNSMENRVYQVETETAPEPGQEPVSRWEAWRVAKFYRPGRWSRRQIEEEHLFIHELFKDDIPVIPPLRFPGGEETLRLAQGMNIWFAVWPRVGGRTLDELNDDQLVRLGRTIARLHITGLRNPGNSRLILNADTYGRESLDYLLRHDYLPENMRPRFKELIESVCGLCDQYLKGVPLQRVHGDLHGGNILWDRERCVLVDFDDMVKAPCVQDIWLVVPGRDSQALRRREVLLSGYEQMKSFDRTQLSLIESLRALRIIHFNAWIARRWEDPAFKHHFPAFGTLEYWRDQLIALEEQLGLLRGESW